MPRFDQPKRFDVFRATALGVDLFVLVLSDDLPNALRPVVVACSLERLEKGADIGLPTWVPLGAPETGLEFDAVASPGSPVTLPKNALVERIGRLPTRARGAVDRALRLVYGYEDWPL